eukprot:TRINITY_DN19220_c0_g1_i1.p1 TRINITY_DN19220_c0_g1~~TRINITY_DN19220_c0_g1_i1.p1  ORF type:complete len:858 (+),score=409.06 TRINITY_DN19220_c0_g1_i1:54-2627(+)
MPLTHDKKTHAAKGSVLQSTPLSDCTVPSAVAIEGVPDYAKVAVAFLKAGGDATARPEGSAKLCFDLTDAEIEEYDGTHLCESMRADVKAARDAFANPAVKSACEGEAQFMSAVASVHSRCVVLNPTSIRAPGETEILQRDPNAPDFIALPVGTARPDHSHEPNAAWRTAGDKLELVALKTIFPGSALTVNYGVVDTSLLEMKYGVAGPLWNPADYLEIDVEIPEILAPALNDYIREAAGQAQQMGQRVPSVMGEGNMTKHFLTKDNPYPLTLRLCARSALGNKSSEEDVDQQLEVMLVRKKDVIFKKHNHEVVRGREMDILIATLSRLSHTTTIRKGAPCHKILREPPTIRGETLAGVPLQKCLTRDTALTLPELTNNGAAGVLTDTQLRVGQAALMQAGVEKFVPKVGQNLPMLWSDDDIEKYLKGCDALRILKEKREQRKNDLAAVTSASGKAIAEDVWAWADALVNKCTSQVAIPEEEVRIDVSKGETKPVAWEDADGDRIMFRLTEAGKLVYSVNGEDRPAIEKLEVVDGVTLHFPLIDRTVELVDPSAPGDAYRLVFSYIRAMAEKAGVDHDIPKQMTFTKPARVVPVIVPAGCMLPHAPVDTRTPTYMEESVWFAAAGDTLHVNHRPGAGNAELLAMRGEVALVNPHTAKDLVVKVPCRAMGAAETEEDIHLGMALQCANLISEVQDEACPEVVVAMPDLALLQEGAAGLSFTVTFKLRQGIPVPRALLYHFALLAVDRKVVVENRASGNSLAGIETLLRQHGDFSKAAAAILEQVAALDAAYGSASPSDDAARAAALSNNGEFTSDLAVVSDGTAERNELLGLQLRIEERAILEKARGFLGEKHVLWEA